MNCIYDLQARQKFYRLHGSHSRRSVTHTCHSVAALIRDHINITTAIIQKAHLLYDRMCLNHWIALVALMRQLSSFSNVSL